MNWQVELQEVKSIPELQECLVEAEAIADAYRKMCGKIRKIGKVKILSVNLFT